MKKIVFLFISVFVFNIIYAQNPKVVSAYNYLRYKEVLKAKEAIDAATKHEKTMNVAKTWWYNGLVYQAISDSCMFKKIKKFCDIEPDAADIALNSYIKAINLNFKDPKWHQLDPLNKEADQKAFYQLLSDQKAFDDQEITMKIIMEIFPNLANVFVNKGVEKYESTVLSDNEKALDYFEKSLFMSSMTRLDTPVIYWTALAAEKAKKYDDAIEYYSALTSLLMTYSKTGKSKLPPYLNPNVLFAGIAKSYINKKDTGNYVKNLKLGIEKFPEESDALVIELFNHYLEKKTFQEALTYIKVAIEKSPDNYIYYYAQGTVYDELYKIWNKMPINNLKKGMKKDDVIILFGQPLETKLQQEKPAINPKQPAKGKQPQKPQTSIETLIYQNITIELEGGLVKSWQEKVPTQKPDVDYVAEALKSYLKSIELNKEIFDSQFNTGILYYNKAVDHFMAANDIPTDKQQLYDQEIKLANEQLKIALPYLEKAHKLNEKDILTIQSLKLIYTRLQMYDEAKKMKDLMPSDTK